MTNTDVRLLIRHQTNNRIIDSVAKKFKLDPDQVMINMNRHGNTTAANIPIAMSEACAPKIMKKGDWSLLSACGAGYTAGSALLKWAI